MSPELLHLHISQLFQTFEKSKINKYADPRKQSYHDKLIELFDKIRQENIEKYSYDQQKNLKEVLDFIFYSIEFLDNSTLTNIPHEIVFCLEKALNDWDATNSYIIVTSLQNSINSYSFNPILVLNPNYYDIIESVFNVKFENKLIQINLPRYLVHDYLANVVLYHELGHFVEMKFQIARRLINTKVSLGEIVTQEEARKAHHHLSELFADVFASQYIGSASNYYLDYIAHKQDSTVTHPSTDTRIQIVNEFLSGKIKNNSLDEILAATEATTTYKLKKRFLSINGKDFEEFIPPILNNDEELHSIFEVGWNLWKQEVKSYKEKKIGKIDKYLIINNLIEKAISNYMVLEKWNK
jgi:hypothetical protein